MLQQTGVVAMTPCISTSNKTDWKPLKEVKLAENPEAIVSVSKLELPDDINSKPL